MASIETETIAEALASGDRLRVLQATLRRVVAQLDDPDAPAHVVGRLSSEVSRLARELEVILFERAAVPPGDDGPPADGPFDPFDA